MIQSPRSVYASGAVCAVWGTDYFCGTVNILACIIFSVVASSPTTEDTSAAAVTQVWTYIGELIFNMLVLVGSVKMSDRIIRETMGL